jgi:hypothetical protein
MERQKMKEVRRSEVRARKSDGPARPTDHDPDLEGMVAGPQEMPDWQREFFEEEQKAKEAAELSELEAQKK